MIMPVDQRCCRCEELATTFYGRKWHCSTHYRFRQMRFSAAYDGKACPSESELFQMLGELKGMTCPHCARQMHWLRKQGGSAVITLQHYANGSMGFLCLACNTKHGSSKVGDAYMAIPLTHKHCLGCMRPLPLDDFYTFRVKGHDAKSSRCRECTRTLTRNHWRAKRQPLHH